MEKDFTQLNYYEMLDIQPDAAALEIRSAYNAALQMYQADSLVSYSFFSQKERKQILALLEKAYLTLINERERDLYDNELIRTGIIDAADRNPEIKRAVNIFDINRQTDNTLVRKTSHAELKEKIAQSRRIKEILARQEISGTDLQEIRNELGVAIEKIHQETKIRIDYLKCIEENNLAKLPAAVFLKGFIKAYLKCLCIEPVDEITTRCMSGFTRKN